MTSAALIGLGEVGRVFVEDLRALRVDDIRAWDTAFGDSTSAASRTRRALGVDAAEAAVQAVDGAALVVSAVTAANTLVAARSAAPGLTYGAWYLDLNSSSPAQKQAAAEVVESHGGRYVEAALMAPIAPARLGSPFLLGGPHASEFAAHARSWGLTGTTLFSPTIGQAAATKLCRSVVVKGLEAAFTEALLAARAYGVEEQVLSSLSNILPRADWERVAEYFVSRSLRHGGRRSEEMLEAAATVADTGIEPVMAYATARRQAWAGQHASALSEHGLAAVLDHIIGTVRDSQTYATTRESTS